MSVPTVRVIHACAYFAPAWVYGGPPRSILGLCHAQAAAGLDVHVVTTTANGDTELPEAVTAAGEYEGVPVDYCLRRRPRGLFYAPAFAATLGRLLAGADILHIHGLWNAVVWDAARVSRRLGKPYVISPRGMLEPAALRHHGWRKRAAYVAFDRRIIRGAALLHATSPAEVATLGRYADRPIVYAPNAVTPPVTRDLPPVRARFGIAADAPIILFLGRVHPIKRLELLAAAFARARAQHPAARLVIAGPDEAGLRPQIEAALGGAAGAIAWTGAVGGGEKQALLAAAAALVLCSASESFGMSVAEALAAGTPVIVTRGLPWDPLAAHNAGLVVDATPTAIGDALAAVLGDPAWAAALGERGRAFAQEAFGWDRAAAVLDEEYRAVLGREARRE